jgi:uncharacterized membrane protein
MIDMNNFLSFQVHGSAAGHKAGDGVAGGVEQLLTFLESLIGLSPSEIFSQVMPGVSAMANIHPLVVHFPIAFLSAFFVTDLIGTFSKNDNLRQLATGLLYLGTLAAGVAGFVGLLAEASVEHGENVHLILERHKTIGFSVLAISFVLSAWRLLSGGRINGVANVIFIVFAAILNIFLILGVDLGGLMVYKYGVAVEAIEVTTQDYFREHTHSH